MNKQPELTHTKCATALTLTHCAFHRAPLFGVPFDGNPWS